MQTAGQSTPQDLPLKLVNLNLTSKSVNDAGPCQDEDTLHLLRARHTGHTRSQQGSSLPVQKCALT